MKYTINRSIHTDFSVFEENKLAARSYFIPFSSTEKMKKSDYKNERFVSDRVQVLSGQWDFAYFDKLSKIPDTVDTDSMSFDTVNVPCTWQRTGYDQIAYINTRYPFPKKPPVIPSDVAVGLYRKKVVLDEGKRKLITFLGVAGALALYVNGSYVGYSEGSHNTAEFDLTSYVNSGENEIFAVVYKWSNGTYLECQDMFRENGIFRDVYITSYKESYINDFLFRSSKNKDGSYDLKISVDGEFSADTRVVITAENDGVLFETELLPSKEITIPALNVKEWSAEAPNIYEATITLYSVDAQIEAIRTYIGFKDVRINGEVYLFNEKPIKFKGVNHHDTHMTKGYAMGIDDMEKDIVLMKEYNCNAVRTSHYPPDPVFMTMCDMYGLYVVDEADIETHGFYAVPYSTYNPNRLSNDTKWATHYLDRVKRMYQRDKNHPSVAMWSLGNESGGYKCQDVCYDYLKEVNPEIPVHYEGAIRSKRWAYDVVSHMYGTQSLMRKILNGTAGDKYKGKPFFQCEYAHAMGNGPGGLEEYMQLFYSSDQFMGGCIWEWADHSVYDENAKYKWTYGGDHNEPIHDGNFCVDGLFYPDRKPSSGALEMKVCYRPLRAEYKGNGSFEIWNTRSFTSSDDIAVSYEVLKNGISVSNGKIDAVISAGERYSFKIDCSALDDKDADVFVNFAYKNKKTDFEIAKEQVVVSTAVVADVTEQKPASVYNGKNITVKFKSGKAVFDKKKGLVSYKVNGKEYLCKKPLDNMNGFVPHIYRGMLDNDRYMMIYWLVLGLKDAKPKLTSCRVVNKDGKKLVRTSYAFVTRGVFMLASSNVDYCFNEDGSAYITASLNKVCPMTAQLPRFGVHCELASDFENVTYYGAGPDENFSDFKEHSPIGVYENTVSNMAHKYIKPQDSGNRGETRFAVISNNSGSKITFNAVKKPFNFNANHFTLNQLIKSKHIEDLPDTKTTFTTVDGFVRGTGSGSCGPIPSKEHLINFGYLKPLSYTFKVDFTKE